MGIQKKHLDLFCINKLKKNDLFKGRSLVIGQQAVYFEEDFAQKILNKNKIFFNDKITLKNGKFTNINEFIRKKFSKRINSEYLFKMLGSTDVDHLDFEKEKDDVDVVSNLNEDISNDLKNKYNNIIDMGSIEHVFNITRLLKNYLKMLKINGYLVISTQSSNMIDHGYYSFSPIFFYDFFEINGFEVNNLYLRKVNPFYHGYPDEKSKVYLYKGRGLENSIISQDTIEITVFLKKIKEVTEIKYPIQLRYRTKEKKIIEDKNLHQNFKDVVKEIVKFLPLWLQKIIFNKIRGKNIKKIKT